MSLLPFGKESLSHSLSLSLCSGQPPPYPSLGSPSTDKELRAVPIVRIDRGLSFYGPLSTDFMAVLL